MSATANDLDVTVVRVDGVWRYVLEPLGEIAARMQEGGVWTTRDITWQDVDDVDVDHDRPYYLEGPLALRFSDVSLAEPPSPTRMREIRAARAAQRDKERA